MPGWAKEQTPTPFLCCKQNLRNEYYCQIWGAIGLYWIKMKKVVIALVLIFGVFLCVSAKKVIKKNVEYETMTDNTASAAFTYWASGEIVVPESIKIGSQEYLVVVINNSLSKKNRKIKAVTLPRSLKIIRAGAFRGCSELVRLTLPRGDYIIEKDAFVGCDKITNLDGNLAPYLEYRRVSGDENIGNQIKKNRAPKFSTFAEKTLNARMQLWQTKKNYETVEQYKNRVTEENRRKKMNEFEEDLKKEYVALYKPNGISTSLSLYDDEYEVFTIPTVFYGELYALVPKEDSQKFRTNYSKVEVLPEFGVVNDTLAIVSCKFKLDGKTYTNTANYAGQGGADYQFQLPALDVDQAIAEERKKSAAAVDNSVDKDIPLTKQDNELTFALVIGNERYEHEQQVPFANNDAKVFAEYCKKTLGLPKENVTLIQDAGLNRMRHDVLALVNTLKAYDGRAKAIVYYAGHGIPDENSKMPYLLPTDGFAVDVKSGYGLAEFYDELAAAPSQSTVVFLDACFSGAKRDGQMLAEARGVAIKARRTMPEGNLVVFSASQGNETAYSDKKHGHGMFTYYLLKHLQETKGETTLNDISDYVIQNVRQTSVRENSGKMQTPTVVPSLLLMDNWKELKIR